MPGTLFAAMATPIPVPQTSSARSASPRATISPAVVPMVGYGV